MPATSYQEKRPAQDRATILEEDTRFAQQA